MGTRCLRLRGLLGLVSRIRVHVVVVKKQLVSIYKKAVLSSSVLTSLRRAASVCEVISSALAVIAGLLV